MDELFKFINKDDQNMIYKGCSRSPLFCLDTIAFTNEIQNCSVTTTQFCKVRFNVEKDES